MEINETSRYLSRRSFLARAAALGAALALGGRSIFAQPTPTLADAGMELAITVDLLAPTRGRYQKPYVAVWVEDASGQPVRTLALWINRRKEEYILHLKRWVYDERTYQPSEGDNLLTTVSSPTRLPGTYTLVWDGLNDQNTPLPEGEYYVCVETARQNGPYALVRESVTLADTGFTKTFAGHQEIGGVSVEYRSRTQNQA